eukprot:gene19591-26273_t
MERELAILKSKIRFINDVIEGAIAIMKQTKEAIIAPLNELDYPTDSHDYLLRMQIYSLTNERPNELVVEEGKETAALNVFRNTPITSIWLSELAEVRELYVKGVAVYDAKHEEAVMATQGVKPSKKRKGAA